MFKGIKEFGKKRILAYVFIAFLVGGILGGMNSVVAAIPAATYEGIKVFSEALNVIEENYVETVDTKEILYGAIRGMLNTLDPHSSFMTPEQYKEMQVETKGSFGGLGIEISIRDGILTVVSPIEGTPAFNLGIQSGDKIVKIEEKTTRNMTIQDAVRLLRGPKGTDVTIWIMREGFEEPKPFTVTRDIIKIRSVKSRTLEDEYGYVKITQFQAITTKDLRKALREMGATQGNIKGLILDLRNNPGGLLEQAVGVSDTFLKEGLIVYTEGRLEGQAMRREAHESNTQPDYPMIVLVNGGSASASEIVAGALQDHKRAVIIGTTTFGKGSVQTIIPLPDKSAMRITTSRYFTPSGTSIQAKGIEPNIIVEAAVARGVFGSKGRLREKDLEGHIEAIPSPGEEESEEKVKESKESKEPEEKKEPEKRADVSGEKKDVQLERALEYLKSWYIFKEAI